MANALGRSLYFHHASAFGVAGQIDRPIQQTIPTQASVSLVPSGGHGTHRVESYSAPGVISFSAAHVEVGGSLDDSNNTHATYACSVIENLNIFNVVTADRVVSRLTVYHPAAATPTSQKESDNSTDPGEPSFSIAGSYFDNLKVAGQRIDVQLDAAFHSSTYSSFFAGLDGPNPSQKHVLVASNIVLNRLAPTDHNYGIVSGIAERYRQWNPVKQPLVKGQHFWCSAANHPVRAPSAGEGAGQPVRESGDLTDFGGIICVPRFGVIFLAEVLVYQNHRHLTMVRVQMCSPGDGAIDGGGTGGGGGSVPPRP